MRTESERLEVEVSERSLNNARFQVASMILKQESKSKDLFPCGLHCIALVAALVEN